jgi:hypothetical protein
MMDMNAITNNAAKASPVSLLCIIRMSDGAAENIKNSLSSNNFVVIARRFLAHPDVPITINCK